MRNAVSLINSIIFLIKSAIQSQVYIVNKLKLKQIIVCLIIIASTTLTSMHSLQSVKGTHLLSPTAFILDLPSHQLLPPLHLHQPYSDLQHQLKYSADEAAKTSSRQQKKRLAGVRSRQKKKKYVEDLQERVKILNAEVERYDSEISKCKDELVEAIRTANSQANQHAYTYSQLQRQAHSQDPDIDTINHLLDVLQSRIGANAKQRQTKLDYYFKQITNSLFPAMHRYQMYCAQHNRDVFSQQVTTKYLQNNEGWTKEFYNKLKLSPQQIKNYQKYKQQFRNKNKESKECIQRLKVIRDEMKRQQEVFERGISEFRLDLDPVQSALIAVFGQKNKLRRQFCLGEQFEEVPKKKIKTD